MKTVYFDRTTLKGLPSKTPTSLDLKVPKDFDMVKDVEVIDRTEQKMNEQGEPIYIKAVYTETEIPILLGYDETLEENDNPYMVVEQKKDEEGNKLYTENIYDEEGNVIDTFTTNKAFDEKGDRNTPIMEEVQKLSDSGNPIYLVPIYGKEVIQNYSHDEETTEVTDTPCLVKIMKTEQHNFNDYPEDFTISEVMMEALIDTVNRSSYEYALADMFLSEDDIELDKSFANTGVGIVQLPPKGNVQFKPIELEAPSNKFKVYDELPEGMSMYINGKKVVDGLVELSSVATSIKVKFYNSTEKFLDVNAFNILYSKYVEEVVKETPVHEEEVTK